MTATLKEDLRSVDQWMARVLRDGAPLAGEYPLVFHEGFPGQVVTLGVDGEIQSACTILLRDFMARDRTYRIGLIGSVTTDPEHRHKGLATRLLLEAERILLEQGAVLSMLWADAPKFYFSRGYKPIGCEMDYTIPSETAARFPTFPGIRPATEADSRGIYALYQRHASRVVRTVEEAVALLACPGMRTLVLERDGELAAYACKGRGADFGRTIHEWGGKSDDVLALVRAHAAEETATESENVFLLAPTCDKDLADAMRDFELSASAGILGLGKLLDKRKAAEILDAQTPAQLRIDVEESGGASPRVTARGPSGEKHLDEEMLLDLLFPSRDNRAELVVTAQACGVDLRMLPIPIFAWGLDSI